MNTFKTKGSHITDDEIRGAEEKFAESLQLAQVGMFNLFQNDVRFYMIFLFEFSFIFIMLLFYLILLLQIEQVSQLVYFAESLLDYHQQSTEILRGLVDTLRVK